MFLISNIFVFRYVVFIREVLTHDICSLFLSISCQLSQDLFCSTNWNGFNTDRISFDETKLKEAAKVTDVHARELSTGVSFCCCNPHFNANVDRPLGFFILQGNIPVRL